MPTLHARDKAIMRTGEVQDAIIAVECGCPEAVFSGRVSVTAV